MRCLIRLVGLAALGLTLITDAFAAPRRDRMSHRPAGAPAALSTQSLPDDAYWSDRFGTPGPGWVNCLTLFHDELIAGAGFERVDGLPARGVARWDGSAWHALGAGISAGPSNYFYSNVEALHVYLDQLIVGGVFDSAGGMPATNVARWNGSAWSAMGTLPEVYDFQEFGGALYAACGDGLYRWTGTAWTIQFAGAFYDLLVFNNQLVGIGFFEVAGSPAVVVSWNGATWDILARQTDVWVNRGAAYGGALYVGGEFDTIDGVVTRGLARWTGSGWAPVIPGSGTASIYDLQVLDNRLVVLGSIYAAPGQLAGRVATWDGTTWGSLPNFTSGYGSARCGCAWNTALYVGGDFSIAGSSAAWGLTRWTGSDWLPVGPSLSRGVNQPIQKFTRWNDRLVAAGYFIAAGDVACPDGLATFDGADWSAIPMPRHGSGNGAGLLYALDTWQGELLVGGHFDQVAGQAINGVAAWNGVVWHGFGAGLNAEPLAFASYEGQLIAAGRFTASGGQQLPHVARWDGTGWQSMGAGLNDDVYALRVHGGQLFAGGKFTASGADPVSRVAVWDGAAWQPVGGGVNDAVNAFEDYAGELVAGGAFTIAGGQPTARIARWNGTAWQPLGAGYGLSVVCLQAYGGELYAARQGNPYVQSAAAAEGAAIARWNGSGWQGLGSGLTAGNVFPFGPRIYTMASLGGYLYLGGDFAGAGYKPAAYVTRWELPGPSDASTTGPAIPVRLAAWPNPARGAVTFRVALRQSDTVTLEIINVQGRRVRWVASRALTEGVHLLAWDGRDDAGREVVPGVYLARIATRIGTTSTRVVRVR